MNSIENFDNSTFNFNVDNFSLNGNQTEFYLNLFSKINCLVTSCLVLIGLIGNSISLATLVNSDQNLPKIACKNYLILLTIVNTLYLVIHWYTATLTHVNYNFHLLERFNKYNTNLLVCKSLGYLKSLCRLLSVILTTIFSVERFLVIYFPLKLINLRKHFIKISGLDIFLAFLASFAATFYIYFYLDLIPVNILFNNKRTNFQYFSLQPYMTSTHCSVPESALNTFFKYYRINLLLLIVCYFTISTTLVLLVRKLKQNQKCLMVYKPSLRLIIYSQYLKDSSSSNSKKQSESFIENNPKNTSLTNINEKLNRPARSSIKMNYNTNKFQNSRMLIILAACYLVMSLPYYLGLFISSIFYQDIIKSHFKYLAIYGFLNMAEILKCSNYSLTGLLFICSGKIFRLHFKRMLKNYFN